MQDIVHYIHIIIIFNPIAKLTIIYPIKIVPKSVLFISVYVELKNIYNYNFLTINEKASLSQFPTPFIITIKSKKFSDSTQVIQNSLLYSNGSF